MKPGTPRRATQAMKSVVIVFDREIDGDYCCGFVGVANTSAGSSPSATLVVAPSSFVRGRKHVGVCFFDGIQSRAQAVSKKGDFCLLTTKLHTRCEEVSWMESTSPLLTPSPTFILPPVSNTNTNYQPTFTSVESMESYLLEDYTRLADHSKNYFLVSCNYDGETYNKAIELIGAPVFTMGSTKSIAMGVVLQDCCPGSEMRVAITATHFQEILKALVGPAPPPSPPRRKRKRTE